MTPLYALHDVHRSYGSIKAVDAVDLEVQPGEFVVIAGPSGSGKTTLLQLLGALDRPSGGRVEFEGKDLARTGDGELAALRRDTLGFIFQQFNLIPTLTAQQNVEAALAPRRFKSAERRRRAAALAPVRIKPAARRERARELLGRMRLEHRLGNLPSQLSGGEQQRVAIARALANGPDVLLADEPTGNLDSATSQEIIDLLRRLSRTEGLSIVLVTHDPAIAGGADRVLRMSDGRVVEDSRVLA